MQPNQTSNKFSTFIGIILLIGIISFTFFINTTGKKENKKVIPEKYLVLFDSTDITNFWKLEKFQTGYHMRRLNLDGNQTNIEVTKIINEYTTKESAPNYGTISFTNGKYIEGTTNEKFIGFNTTSTDKYHSRLEEVANLFLQYQIHSITSEPENGDFTCIELKNDVKIFLIKQNIEAKNYHYRSLLRESEYINDSTKLFLPKEY